MNALNNRQKKIINFGADNGETLVERLIKFYIFRIQA